MHNDLLVILSLILISLSMLCLIITSATHPNYFYQVEYFNFA